MTPSEVLDDLRQRGAGLRLSPDGASIQFRGDEADMPLIRTEKTWLLMLLHHDAGGDAVDPRLAFLASGDDGLTRNAVRTRLKIAFGLTHDAADALIDVAIKHGYLRKGTDQLYRPHGRTAWVVSQQEKTEAMVPTTTEKGERK